jgi:prepilin-type processing-associated H-X9-DG protein
VGDNDSIYSGFSNDLHRYAGYPGGSPPWLPPIPDGAEDVGRRDYLRFGSAHGDGFYMAYCDGSVKFIGFDVDPEAHFRAGHRRDGGVAVDRIK